MLTKKIYDIMGVIMGMVIVVVNEDGKRRVIIKEKR